MEKKLYGTVLIKAAQILDYLADEGESTIQNISKKTKLTAPTISKILETLVHINYVSKNEKTKTYRLGTKFLQYQYQFSNIMEEELISKTEPIFEKLQKTIDETIHLSIPVKNEVVYINKLEPKNQSIYMTSKVGMTRSLYSSGMGKAVLSSYSDDKIAHFLDYTELKPATIHTITDKKALWDEIKNIRDKGYAIDDEEQELDCYCIATTLEKDNKVIGAMSISIPKFRVSVDYEQQIIKNVLGTKKEIEAIL